MAKKVGVILSGSGFMDGAEIQESVATLMALDLQGFEISCFAPDVDQMHVVNHLKGEESAGETRNVLVESARITRGNISPLEADSCDDMDAVFFPGGFGVAKNLCDYAVKGDAMTVLPVVEEVLKRARAADKPIAALCISPVLLGKVFGDLSPLLTVGAAGPDAENLEKLGGKHEVTSHEGVVVDPDIKLVTGPCYMLEAQPGQIFNGAMKVVEELKKFL